MLKKDEKRILEILISFFLGLFLAIFFSHPSWITYNFELRFFEVLISLLTLVFAVYLAVVLDKSRSKGQKYYAYIEKKYDRLWQEFITLSNVIDLSNNLEVGEVSKLLKNISMQMSPLISIVKSFGKDSQSLLNLEAQIDELDSMISNLSVSNNIYNFSAAEREAIIEHNDLIHQSFANSYKSICL